MYETTPEKGEVKKGPVFRTAKRGSFYNPFLGKRGNGSKRPHNEAISPFPVKKGRGKKDHNKRPEQTRPRACTVNVKDLPSTRIWTPQNTADVELRCSSNHHRFGRCGFFTPLSATWTASTTCTIHLRELLLLPETADEASGVDLIGACGAHATPDSRSLQSGLFLCTRRSSHMHMHS